MSVLNGKLIGIQKNGLGILVDKKSVKGIEWDKIRQENKPLNKPYIHEKYTKQI